MEYQETDLKHGTDFLNKYTEISNFGDYQLTKRPLPSLDQILEYTAFTD